MFMLSVLLESVVKRSNAKFDSLTKFYDVVRGAIVFPLFVQNFSLHLNESKFSNLKVTSKFESAILVAYSKN